MHKDLDAWKDFGLRTGSLLLITQQGSVHLRMRKESEGMKFQSTFYGLMRKLT